MSERLLSDPQAVIASGSKERPILAESRPSRTARIDPNRSFKVPDTNVGYRIAKRPSICRDQLGSLSHIQTFVVGVQHVLLLHVKSGLRVLIAAATVFDPEPAFRHCQSKFVYFAKASEPDSAVIDFPAFFRVDLSGSMAAPSIWNFALTTPEQQHRHQIKRPACHVPARPYATAAGAGAVLRRRAGAPTRRRRSLRETAPPNTMMSAPAHIQGTNGS